MDEATEAHVSTKKYWVATGQNFAGMDVEFFTDPLAYGRAVREAAKQHERGEVDTYVHGDNMINSDRRNPVYGGLHIASLGELGLDVEFFTNEQKYLERLLELKENEYYEKVDALSYNGPDVEFDPEADADDELAAIKP